DLHGPVQRAAVRQLHDVVRHRDAGEHADPVRRLPADPQQRAHVSSRYDFVLWRALANTLGVFGLLQIVGFVEYIRTQLPSRQFQTLLRAIVLLIFAVSLGGLVLLTVGGVIAPWTGRFYSL